MVLFVDCESVDLDEVASETVNALIAGSTLTAADIQSASAVCGSVVVTVVVKTPDLAATARAAVSRGLVSPSINGVATSPVVNFAETTATTTSVAIPDANIQNGSEAAEGEVLEQPEAPADPGVVTTTLEVAAVTSAVLEQPGATTNAPEVTPAARLTLAPTSAPTQLPVTKIPVVWPPPPPPSTQAPFVWPPAPASAPAPTSSPIAADAEEEEDVGEADEDTRSVIGVEDGVGDADEAANPEDVEQPGEAYGESEGSIASAEDTGKIAERVEAEVDDCGDAITHGKGGKDVKKRKSKRGTTGGVDCAKEGKAGNGKRPKSSMVGAKGQLVTKKAVAGVGAMAFVAMVAVIVVMKRSSSSVDYAAMSARVDRKHGAPSESTSLLTGPLTDTGPLAMSFGPARSGGQDMEVYFSSGGPCATSSPAKTV